jgi:hypothetical protein
MGVFFRDMTTKISGDQASPGASIAITMSTPRPCKSSSPSKISSKTQALVPDAYSPEWNQVHSFGSFGLDPFNSLPVKKNKFHRMELMLYCELPVLSPISNYIQIV